MATNTPPIHHWNAGEAANADRMNEITTMIDWLRNPPMVHLARRLSNQSLPVTTWTSVSFDTVINSYDPYEFFDAGTPDQIICTVPGWYAIEGVLTVDNSAVNARLTMALYKQNSELILRYDQQGLENIAGTIGIRKEASMFLNIGDTLQLKAHVSAGARNMLGTATNEAPQLRMRWVSN